MENKNNSGIFLGVIGVATLVVTMVGATFAYFAASVNGETGAAQAGSASVAGTITMNETKDVRENMIPVTEEVMTQSYAQSGTGAKAKCAGLSAAGGSTVYNLCSTHTFTISNSATVAQTVYVSLKTESNDFSNLWYALYDENGLVQNTKAIGSNSLQSDFTKVGEESALGTFKVVPTGTDSNITSTLLAATNGSKTYTLVLYVHDINDDQTAADSGKSFTGTIQVSSSDGTNNITGMIEA